MKIIKVEYLYDYKINITFSDNTKHIFDFEQSIKEFINKYDKFHELLNTSYFSKVRLNEEWNTIEWENGFDICPDLVKPQYAIA